MKRLLVVLALTLTGCDFRSALEKCIDAGWCADEPDGGAADGGDLDAGAPRDCGPTGWCWETLTPHVTLSTALTVSPSEAYAFGDFGAALRFDGTTWTAIAGRRDPLGPAVSLGPGMVLVGTSSGLVVLDGGAWKSVAGPTQQITALGRDPGGELFATTSQAWYHSLDGVSWATIPQRCTALDFALPAPGKGWVTCEDGGIFTRAADGGWLAQTSPTANDLYSVWSVSPEQAWAAGLGTLLRFTEAAGWEAVDSGTPDSVLHGGSLAVDDTWVVSGGAGLVHWTSTGAEPPVLSVQMNTEDISLTGDGGWMAGDQGTLARLEGTTWVEWNVGGGWRWWSAHGAGPADVWVAGSRGAVEHFDGEGWTSLPVPLDGIDLYSVYERSPLDVWTVGQSGAAYHWDGAAWAGVDLGYSGNFYGVWVDADGVAWVVGSAGTMRQVTSDGTATSVNNPVTTDFSDVWGAGREFWATAASGQVLHCALSADAGCDLLPPPGPPELTSIYASSSNDIWVISTSGTLHQWNGATWTQRRPISGPPLLHSVRGDGALNGGVYVMGDNGFVQHFGRDGGTGSLLPVDTYEPILSSFSANDGGLTFISGGAGALLRRGR